MPPERRAVLILLGLAVGGQGIRAVLARPGDPPGQVSLLQTGPPPTSVQAHRDSALALARPLGPGERIDLDRASVAEIARLPRVGIRLAKAIVADRERRGPFGSLEALDRVPGVGPGLLATLSPHARFSQFPESAAVGQPAVVSEPVAVPGPAPAGEPAPSRAGGPLDLNHATQEELERLPFIGPYMAGQIVAWRERHGPFPAVDSLVKVPGIGPATLKRVRHLLTVG